MQFWGLEGLVLVRNNKASFLGMRLGWGGPQSLSRGTWERGVGGYCFMVAKFLFGR